MSGTVTTLVKTESAPRDPRFNTVIRPATQSTARPSSTAAHSNSTRRCPVCFRIACPLRSHKQYAQSRGLLGRATAIKTGTSSSGTSRPSSERSLESHEKLHPGPIEIGAGNADAFIHFPLPKGVKAEISQLFQDFFILHQTKSTTGPKAGPSPLSPLMKEILPACTNNAALCHSIVAGSAVWHASYRGQLEPDARILSLHGQAIQTFREALRNPATACSNANIVAAVSLTHHQVLCRSHSGLKAHVDGIKTLVNARGGLHNVGWVAHLILWIDYYTCLYVNQEPHFIWPLDNTIRPSISPPETYGSAFESLQLGTLLDPDLRQLCFEVCRTIELLESTTGNGNSMSVQDYYRYKRTTICIQLGHLHAQFHGQGTINECVSLTLNMIVLKVFFMHVLDESRIDLCRKLRIALELTGVDVLQNEPMNLLTWIMFTAGALAPKGSQWTGYFIDLLKVALAAHFTSVTEPSFLEVYLKGYIGKVVRTHVWSSKLLAHALEATLVLLTPTAKKPLVSEKKMASASGLFPG